MRSGGQFTAEPSFRKPTEWEFSLLERLMEAEFPGRDKLASLVHNALVRTIDQDGGLELQSEISGEAPVVKRVPVEAEAKDSDGFTIHVLLHVVAGKPVELEIYKDDGSAVQRMPAASAFELIVLPPAPIRD
jgi:hypothetical protein